MSEDLRDALALRLGHVQPAFGAAPEHVFGAARPFVVDEVAQLALAQPRAIVVAELPVADYLVGAHAMAPENRPQRWRRDLWVAREEGVARRNARLRAEIASRQGRGRRPGRLERGKLRLEALHDVLREPPIGRARGAEDRE